VINCDVFRCRITEVIVNIHEHRHDAKGYTESPNSGRAPTQQPRPLSSKHPCKRPHEGRRGQAEIVVKPPRWCPRTHL